MNLDVIIPLRDQLVPSVGDILSVPPDVGDLEAESLIFSVLVKTGDGFCSVSSSAPMMHDVY